LSNQGERLVDSPEPPKKRLALVSTILLGKRPLNVLFLDPRHWFTSFLAVHQASARNAAK
jgi:hypothetical protein